MLDYEPHVIDQWSDNSLKPRIIENFLGDLQEFKQVIAQYNVKMILDVPILFSVTDYQDLTLLHAVSSIVDEILLMSYRDTFEGSNSLLSFIDDSVSILRDLNKPFYLALETQAIDPPYITFFEEGTAAVDSMVLRIDEYFMDEDLYKGTAIHFLYSYLNLDN